MGIWRSELAVDGAVDGPLLGAVIAVVLAIRGGTPPGKPRGQRWTRFASGAIDGEEYEKCERILNG